MATPSPRKPGAPPAPPSAPPGPDPVAQFELMDQIEAEAIRQHVPPDFALRIAHKESRFNPNARSPKGAQGVMQLMPDTARALGVTNAFDPAENIRAGVTYQRQLLDRHGNDRRLAAASYNAGPGAVAKYGGVPPFKETQAYVADIPGGAVDPVVAQFEALEQQEGAPPPAPPATADPTRPPIPVLGSAPGAPLAPPPPATDYDPYGRVADVALRGGRMVAETFDPRNPSGRRNLAGAAGAGAAALATGGLSILPTMAVTGLGAAAGGVLAEGGEQIAGTKPQDPNAIPRAGIEQGAYEVLGQTALWPLRALGTRVVASKVGQAAQHGLSAARDATMAGLQSGLTAAGDVLRATKRATGDVVSGVRESATRAVEDTRTRVRASIGAAESQDAAATAAHTAATEGRVAAATAPYDRLAGAPPRAAHAGRFAQEVIEGPATAARNRAGEAVTQAAKTGPPVRTAALKAEAQRIIEQELAPSAEAFPRTAAEPAADAALPVSKAVPGESPAAAAVRARQAELLAQVGVAQDAAVQEKLKHPIMGVLQRILNAGDEVSFEAAHGFKRELYDAVQGSWDDPEVKRVTALTQHLSGLVRDTLKQAGHGAYEQATAAYEKIAPLFTHGYAAKLSKEALDNPEAIVKMIRPDEPTSVGMLREVLTTQSAQGGEAVAGKAAWDAVRSAWTHKHVIAGGIDGLEDRLGKLTPEFLAEFAGDDSGKAIFSNLRSIVDAVKQAKIAGGAPPGPVHATAAKAAGEQATLQATRGARATVRSSVLAQRPARDVAEQGVRDARSAITAAKAPTPDEVRFLESSIAPKNTHSPAELVMDGIRVAATGGPLGSYWGGLAALRLIRGPKGKDLLYFMSHSSPATQAWVKLLTSAVPAQVSTAPALRTSGVLNEGGRVDQLIGHPPPAPR